MDQLMIGWTTVETRESADELAAHLVRERLAACVQVDGPIASHYIWEEQVNISAEYRLMVKFLASKSELVTEFLQQHHPYQTPQWISVACDKVLPSYLQWALESSGPGA